MSERTWTEEIPAHWRTGRTGTPGAMVYPFGVGTGLYQVVAWCGRKHMQEEPIPTLAEAQRVASEWLDLREAETHQRAKNERTWIADHVRPETYWTGDLDIGAGVEPVRGGNGWVVRAHYWRRRMHDEQIGTLDDAKRLASRWLDEREAEAQAQKGGTT